MRSLVAAVCLALLCSAAHAESGIASVYGGRDGYCGKRVAAGGVLDCRALTAAHRTLPFGTLVKVCRVRGNCVVVRITDRGPYIRGRIIDLTPVGARALGFSGLAHVTVDVLQLGASHARHLRRHRHVAVRH